MIGHGRRGMAVLVSAVAIVAFVLMSSPAHAQSSAAGVPGAAATPPTADKVVRRQMLFVGTSTMRPFIDWAVKQLRQTFELPDPIEQFEGSAAGFKKFCAGVGAEFPDAVGATRPMRKDEFSECQTNGVLDIIEVRIGESAIAIVTKKGNPVFDVTPSMMYHALAAEVPKNGEFERNTIKQWNETTRDKSVPALPIRVLLPNEDIGVRGFFDDRFLQGGCRHVPDIDAIFSADDRAKKCTTLRTDVIKELSEPIADTTLLALKDSAPGTLGVADFLLYKENADKLDLLPVLGVLPSHKSIDDYSYVAVNPLILYFKRAHMRDKGGRGVVRGIREFMAVIVSDAAVGADGQFAKMGLEPYSEEEIADIRLNVRKLRRYER
jgi:phosphate transport system substrate-binding protein